MNKIITRIARVGLLAMLLAATVTPSVATQADEVLVGTGWKAFIACATCLGGASAIVAGGPAAILEALYFPGGSAIAAGCVAACIEAVS